MNPEVYVGSYQSLANILLHVIEQHAGGFFKKGVILTAPDGFAAFIKDPGNHDGDERKQRNRYNDFQQGESPALFFAVRGHLSVQL